MIIKVWRGRESSASSLRKNWSIRRMADMRVQFIARWLNEPFKNVFPFPTIGINFEAYQSVVIVWWTNKFLHSRILVFEEEIFPLSDFFSPVWNSQIVSTFMVNSYSIITQLTGMFVVVLFRMFLEIQSRDIYVYLFLFLDQTVCFSSSSFFLRH